MNSLKTYKINISIDDISPHPKSSVRVLERCFELIDIFPTIKFTLFVPVCYTRLGQISFPISEYPNFCKIIKKLPKDNFEIGYHGYRHGITPDDNPAKVRVSNNDEFKYLNYNQAMEKFVNIDKEIEKTDLVNVFKPIFRPPAWKMSPDSLRAADDWGVEILALTPDIEHGSYGGAEKIYESKIVYYNVNPPFNKLKLYKKTEMVYHACEWDDNYLSKELTKDLESFLLKNKDKIEFCFMEGLL